MVVYVKFKEKFHGRMLLGNHLKTYRSKVEAIRQIGQWNSLSSRDNLIVKGIYTKRPKGFHKTKYRGIYIRK